MQRSRPSHLQRFSERVVSLLNPSEEHQSLLNSSYHVFILPHYVLASVNHIEYNRVIQMRVLVSDINKAIELVYFLYDDT